MSTHALGIMVSAEALHAVLLERTEEGTVVQFKVSTSASRGGEDLPFTEPGEEVAPGMEEEPEDVTIQFGDEGGGDDLFMGSEFEEYEESEEEFGGSEDASQSWNFQAQLDDLLEQCAERGYEDPEIAFCTTASEVDEVELRLPPDQGGEQTEGKQGLSLPASRSTLLEMLEEQYEGSADGERVGFVPMHETGDGRQRVLAFIARPGGTVLSTLSAMHEQTLSRTPRARLLDTEVSLYLGLSRSVLQLPPGTPEKTILVRSTTDDTLILFIEGNTLRQSEYLPELTIEDTAETICSRVLLLQDEYGIGEVQHVLLLAEENRSELTGAFKSYFTNASLRQLHAHLPNGENTKTAAYVAAKGAALRLLDDPDFGPFFQSVNLLPEKYTESRFRLPVGWSVPALLMVLALTTFGFVWYYVVNARAISERRTELRTLERQVGQVDLKRLQRRIDSVQSRAAQYNQGLELLGGLLKGSNKWSRKIADVTAKIRAIDGVSIDQWSPASNTEVALTGRSRARARVVELADQLNGEINSLTFTEVREITLYNFEITVPLDTTKPEAVTYWRKHRLAAGPGEESPKALAAAPSESPSSESPQAPGARADTSKPENPGSAGSPSSASIPTANDSASNINAWTIVVASFSEREAARTVVQSYRDRLSESDYAIRVHHSPENGWYRVGIGTFSSFDAGWSTLQRLGGKLPEDAWLHGYSSSLKKTKRTSESPQDSSGP